MREQYNTANQELASIPSPGNSTSTGHRLAISRTKDFASAHPRPSRLSGYEIWKRSFDLTAASLLVLGLLPIFILIAIVIKLTSKGPVFFRHRRLGLGGKEFHCLKFRTMISNAEELLITDPQLRKHFDEKFKIDDDPRITRVGRFLRCTSLDELPQFFHVLSGKMSLIGPRPIIDREREKYSIYVGKLLSVRPGLSGLWQVSGRSDTTYSQRVLLDMYYIDNRSISLDLRIFFKTFITVLRKTGAC